MKKDRGKSEKKAFKSPEVVDIAKKIKTNSTNKS